MCGFRAKIMPEGPRRKGIEPLHALIPGSRFHLDQPESIDFSLKGTECVVMRNLNSELASSDVHISSPAPGSVNRGYHEIVGTFKRNTPTPTSGGRGKTDWIEEMTIVKLAYRFSGSLPSNDERTPKQNHDTIEVLLPASS